VVAHGKDAHARRERRDTNNSILRKAASIQLLAIGCCVCDMKVEGRLNAQVKRQEPERTLYARRRTVAAIHISKSHGISIRANPGNRVLRHIHPNWLENYQCRD
jgi:hypothetical protein